MIVRCFGNHSRVQVFHINKACVNVRTDPSRLDRRSVLKGAVALSAVGVAGPMAMSLASAATPNFSRPIPYSGERIPVLGLGSYLKLDVGNDTAEIAACATSV